MAIFLVTPLAQNFERLRSALDEKEMDYFPLQTDAGLLVADTGTSAEVSNKIGVTVQDSSERPLGAALITRVPSYYGIGQTLMWEWIKSRMEQS